MLSTRFPIGRRGLRDRLFRLKWFCLRFFRWGHVSFLTFHSRAASDPSDLRKLFLWPPKTLFDKNNGTYTRIYIAKAVEHHPTEVHAHAHVMQKRVDGRL